jgi:hypothetical protein
VIVAAMSFESLHNYYETLVFQHIMNTLAREDDVDQDFLEGGACVALNNLPCHYVRHDKDMALFLTARDREKMQQRISEAVPSAIQHVRQGRKRAEKP